MVEMEIGMNLQDVYKFMDKFAQSSISEIQLEMDGTKISCKKEINSNSNINSVSKENIVYSHDDIVSENDVEDIENTEEGISKDDVLVRAKVAGTFYRAESPDSPPFVQVGQEVKKGDVLGMIEAMKMMNNITSPVDGEVVNIVAGNDEIVGYGDLIIVLHKKEEK